MKTGISTASFFLRDECENAIVRIADAGADCAEVFLGTYYEFRPEFAKKYAPKDGKIAITSVHALSTAFEPQLFNPSRRVRGDGFYWLDQIMRSAQLFGARKYTFHGYIDRGGSWSVDETAGYLNAAIDFCARYGVELCLENVGWCTYNRPGLFKELKARCPSLKGVFDVKQARRSGYPYNMYIEDMSGAISHAHISDVDENGKICLPGKGVYDFGEIIGRLKDVGFDGEILIEVYGGDYGDASELKQSLEYIKEIVYKLG